MIEQFNLFIFHCWQSFVLGIVQGLTEFFPISSTAHLKIIPVFLGWEDPGVSISASLQLGSAIAIILYFKHDLNIIIKPLFSSLINRKLYNEENNRLAKYIFIASLPICIMGLLIKIFWLNYYDSFLRSLSSIAIVSIFMALILLFSDIYGRKEKGIDDLSINNIIFIGISQAFALIPGVSRSGITLSSALYAGLNRNSAARLSFLVGIPAITISGFVELLTLLRFLTLSEITPLLIGIISSFISSLIAIDFLLKFLKSNNTYIFVVYRLIMGFLLLLSL